MLVESHDAGPGPKGGGERQHGGGDLLGSRRRLGAGDAAQSDQGNGACQQRPPHQGASASLGASDREPHSQTLWSRPPVVKRRLAVL
jgi:hypothetical protein